VTPIATATNTAGPPITVGNYPDAIAITPDGKTAYVANWNSGTVTPIATATNTAGPAIPVGSQPENIAITPDGKTAYVPNSGSGSVTPIATATNTAGPPIMVGNGPQAIAITPDGRTAYVATVGSGTVTPIATATNTAGPPITVGAGPVAIAITPATVGQGPAFTSGSAATAAFGAAFTFTVTATGDPAPTITRTGRLPSGVRFADYGDGTATISGTPAQAAAGAYPLTLTARNKNGTATQAFTLTITRAAAIREIPATTARVGVPLSLTVRATGYPAPALAESGPLPGGLTFTDNGNGTATIAGTPAAGSGIADGRHRHAIGERLPRGAERPCGAEHHYQAEASGAVLAPPSPRAPQATSSLVALMSQSRSRPGLAAAIAAEQADMRCGPQPAIWHSREHPTGPVFYWAGGSGEGPPSGPVRGHARRTPGVGLARVDRCGGQVRGAAGGAGSPAGAGCRRQHRDPARR